VKRINCSAAILASVMLAATASLSSSHAADIKPAAQSTPLQTAISEFDALHLAKAKPLFVALSKDEKQKKQANYYLGRIAMIEVRYPAAREYFEAGIEIEPNNADEYYWLSMACGAMFQLPSGSGSMELGLCYMTNLNEAAELNPNHVPALLALHQFNRTGPILGGASQTTADELLTKLDKLSKPAGDVARLLTLTSKKETDKAVALSLAMITAHPNSERALVEAGKTLSLNKRYAEALAAFEKVTAIKLTAENYSFVQNAYFEIGQISWRTKADLDRGIAALNKAADAQVFPVNGYTNWSYWRLALLYQLKGDAVQYKKYVALLESTGVEKGALLIGDIERLSAAKR